MNCAGCSKEIIQGSYQTIGTSNYHPACFLCSSCQSGLDNGYIESGDNYLCEECYSNANLSKCHACAQFIKDAMVQVGGHDYHAKCFVCAGCQSAFQGGKFVNKDDKAYCTSCAEEKSEFSCQSCDQKIVGKVFTAIGHNWHPACFKCQKCFKQITAQFKVVDNQGYHPECMQNICAACHKGCGQEYLQAGNGDYLHKDCQTAYKVIMGKKKEQGEGGVSEDKKAEPVVEQQTEKKSAQPGQYTLQQIKSGEYDSKMDCSKKETYLAEEDFEAIFEMSREEFNSQAMWKRNAQKKTASLF